MLPEGGEQPLGVTGKNETPKTNAGKQLLKRVKNTFCNGGLLLRLPKASFKFRNTKTVDILQKVLRSDDVIF